MPRVATILSLASITLGRIQSTENGGLLTNCRIDPVLGNPRRVLVVVVRDQFSSDRQDPATEMMMDPVACLLYLGSMRFGIQAGTAVPGLVS